MATAAHPASHRLGPAATTHRDPLWILGVVATSGLAIASTIALGTVLVEEAVLAIVVLVPVVLLLTARGA